MHSFEMIQVDLYIYNNSPLRPFTLSFEKLSVTFWQ
jgi:hypothetical protein